MIVALLLVAAPWTEAGPTDKIALRPAADFAIGGAGLAGWLVPELLKQRLAPAHCVVCNGDDNSGLPGTGGRGSLNAVDAWFHDSMTGWVFSRKTADTVSNVWTFALLPAGAIAGALLTTGPYASDGAGLRATVIVLQNVAVSAAVIQTIKYVAARKRPFVRYGHGTDGPDPETGGTYDVNDRDSHISYPSGHTTMATSLGVSLAMTATLEESSAAPWLWGAAVIMTVSTASLRMMAEKHYFTDVATGAAIGAACGVILPLLHKRGSALSQQASVSVGPGQGGAPLVGLAGAF
jgi:membrane-associated phospholipid phosphatase